MNGTALEVGAAIKEIVCRELVLADEQYGEMLPFAAMGADSLDIMQLRVEFEDAFQMKIDADQMVGLATPFEVRRFIEKFDVREAV